MGKLLFFGQLTYADDVEREIKEYASQLQNKIDLSDGSLLTGSAIREILRVQEAYFRKLGAVDVCFSDLGNETLVEVKFNKKVTFGCDDISKISAFTKTGMRNISFEGSPESEKCFILNYCVLNG